MNTIRENRKNGLSEFLRRKLKDVNTGLIPLKLTFFVCWGALASMDSFGTIFLSSLGFGPRLIGILFSTLPLNMAISQIVIMAIADRLNKRKLVLVLCLLGFTLTSTAMLLLPPVTSVLSRGADGELSTDTPEIIFYSCLLLQIFQGAFKAASYNLVDSIGLILMTENSRASFGQQKMFSSVSVAVFPLLAGALMDNYPKVARVFKVQSNGSDFNNNNTFNEEIIFQRSFTPLVWLLNVMILFIAVFAYKWLKVDLVNNRRSSEENRKGPKMWKQLFRADVIAFVLVVIVMGVSFGLTQLFFPLRMTELGADRTIIGASVTLSTTFGILSLMFSRQILEKIGHSFVLTLALFSHSVKFFLASLFRQPEWFLLCSPLDCICYALGWNTIIMYATKLGDISMAGTIVGIFSTIHFGAGFGIGGVVGGTWISRYGFEIFFRVWAYCVFAIATMHALFNFYHHFRNKTEEMLGNDGAESPETAFIPGKTGDDNSNDVVRNEPKNTGCVT